MDPQFWHNRWQANQIGFHEGAANRYLAEFGAQVLGSDGHVLVPLCGKTVDLIHLHQQGLRVTGVELSELALQQFTRENSLTVHVQADDSVRWYRFEELPRLQVAVGDFFDPRWSRAAGSFEAVYDRAALVALPPNIRPRYAAHITQLVQPGGRMLLISREHDSDKGPPFSVPTSEVQQLYSHHWSLAQLARHDGTDNAGVKSDVVYQAIRQPGH